MNETCIFCRIVRGEIPAERVLETDNVIAIRDVNPQAPVHVLVLPKTHVAGLLELPAEDVTWNRLIGTVQEVVRVEGLVNGFRMVVNQGSDGGQTVPHLHLHVLGGRALHWPPG
ncbi:MAG: apaH [Chloroflexi bacterium]|nr:apaH [Chloroflexota bacterium]